MAVVRAVFVREPVGSHLQRLTTTRSPSIVTSPIATTAAAIASATGLSQPPVESRDRCSIAWALHAAFDRP
jgi:hypothetical protein